MADWLIRLPLLLWYWLVQHLSWIITCTKTEHRPEYEESHKLLLTYVPLLDIDVVNNDNVESLDRRSRRDAKRLATSSYSLNLSSQPILVDKPSEENGTGAQSALNLRRSYNDISLSRCSSDKVAQPCDDVNSTGPQRLAQFFSRPFRNIPLKRAKSVCKLETVAQP
ncbi:hypothetical protein KIN20_035913 [Parelaphostrongylus tenuis]|uniref:Uncharacterized protein n=1 Tax=Parelaphostrongylus tenuis TaxID=148309 RepID=A0AAD5RCH7_PARTN|nr:hypothetical protein KIN20_035913 [Parelaphostrongylus tenuis]